MKKICQITGREFEITDEDLAFYEKMGVPTPTLCPEERARKRMAWRDIRNLRRAKCDATGEMILTSFGEHIKFPIYSNKYWWSDAWDAKNYAQEFDFSRPFFEQFEKLRDTVPHMARSMVEETVENSDYCNGAINAKDCYLSFNIGFCEKCLYCENTYHAYDCLDCYEISQCEACYEVMLSTNCTFSKYLLNCKNSTNCSFCADLIGCSDCFGCVGLRNKQYYFWNEKLTKDEWEKKVNEAQKVPTVRNFEKLLEQKKNFPVKYYTGDSNENFTGDFLRSSKNVQECYRCNNLEDSKYCYLIQNGKNYNNFDVSIFGRNVTNCYEGSVLGDSANNVLFSVDCWQEVYDIYYSHTCLQNSHNLFGCVGMRHAEYCILNKQYTRAEYEALVPKIIEHMKKTKEWGESFPIKMSPYAYNMSAQELFPLTKEKILAYGYVWQEPKSDISNVQKIIEDPAMIPYDINEVPDDVLNWAIKCKISGRLFKIQKLELEFYRKNNLPIPHLHPDERQKRRFALRNPLKLYHRTCDKPGCTAEFETTYAPDRPEKVYCEKCYLESLN